MPFLDWVNKTQAVTSAAEIAQKGELPDSKIGTQWRSDRDEINNWMKSLRQVMLKKHRLTVGNHKSGKFVCRA